MRVPDDRQGLLLSFLLGALALAGLLLDAATRSAR